MEITITEKIENPLLNRDEVKGTIKYEGATPSNAKLIESLAKEFKTETKLIVIKKINTHFSKQEADFFTLIYKKKENKEHVEKMTKHLRKKAEEEQKKAAEAKKEAEKPKEEPAAVEAPKEEKKEEAPVEEPKEEKKEEGEQ